MSRKDRPASLRIMHSSGGVLFKEVDGGIMVAMIIPKNKRVLTLPKGLIDRGEDPEATALREVREETGMTGEIIKKIGEVSYWFYIKDENTRYKKTVHYYLMRYQSGSPEDHDWEIEEVIWIPLEEALKKASYKTDKEILKKTRDLLMAAR